MPEKVLVIVAQNNYQPKEYLDTCSELKNAGIFVDTASITTETASASDSSTLKPDIAVKDANIDDYLAIVVIGGPGALSLAEYPEVLDLIKTAYNAGKIVAAICISPLILAKAGILSGKKATVWCDSEKSQARGLENAGAVFVDKPIVQDSNMITADGPSAASDFGKKIAEAVGK
ncbi:DJ-1/PfpI family protein [Candidatus Woesearchaeota archaeon]|nr:DJ-1/PfpI family protein [Candidatus Woesearchaeota archaeon]